MKVFIADDSLLVCARLIAMLMKIDNVELVGHAQNAHEAVESIKKFRPDIIILDIQMGKGSGIDVLHRSKQEHPSLVAVMLTNFSDPFYRRKCLDAGADYFFDKSMEFFLLQESIKQLIDRPQARQLFDWTNKNLQHFSE